VTAAQQEKCPAVCRCTDSRFYSLI